MNDKLFNFFGRIAIRRLPAKSQQRFEAQEFLEITDTAVPRETNPPTHLVPDKFHFKVPSVPSSLPNDPEELKIITLEPSDLPPGDEVPQEHLDFLRGKTVLSSFFFIILRKFRAHSVSGQAMGSDLINHLQKNGSACYYGDWTRKISLLSGEF